MSRRKKSTATQPPGSRPEPATALEARPAENSDLPSPNVRWLISVLVVGHLFAIGLSMTAVVASSDTQVRLNGSLLPYTMPTHFRTQGERLFLTSGEETESPLRIQVQRSIQVQRGTPKPTTVNPLDDESNWETIQPRGIRGLGSNDRYTRWLTAVMTLVNSESPSLVAELLLPMLRVDESITAVRIIRLSSALSLSSDESFTVPYTAALVRSGESASLVRINEARLSTFDPKTATDNSAENAR